MLTHNKLIVARYKQRKCSHTFLSKHVGKAQAVESEDKQHCSADREQSGTAMCRFTGCKRFWPAMPSRPKFFYCSAGQGEYNPHAANFHFLGLREKTGAHTTTGPIISFTQAHQLCQLLNRRFETLWSSMSQQRAKTDYCLGVLAVANQDNKHAVCTARKGVKTAARCTTHHWHWKDGLML